MTRRDTINPWTGRLDKRVYDAPDGYYLEKGAQRPDMGDLRLKLMERYAETPANVERAVSDV